MKPETFSAMDSFISQTPVDTKEKAIATEPETPPSGKVQTENNGTELDEAFRYLHDHAGSETQAVDLHALRRKIDWRIVPIMFAAYTLQFIDKVVINVGTTSSPTNVHALH